MAVEIVMPQLGWTMEEGTLAEWVKQDGDIVAVGDILFMVETDKALNEVESMDAGILRIPPDAPAPGATVPVGTVLAYLVEEGESLPAAGTPQKPVVPRESRRRGAEKPGARPSEPTISPRARRIAKELGVDWTRLEGSGRTGRIVEQDVRAAATAREEVRASPLARRLALELGVDLEALAVRMPGQRIERADVEAAAVAAVAEERVRVSPVRQLTATRMIESSRTTAPVTLTTEVDATELVRLRAQLRDDPVAADQVVPTYTDLIVRVVAQALKEHPALNARLEDSGEIALSAAVHLGIAVDTERGLLVPVLRDVQDRSVRQIALESAALIEAASAGRLGPDELRGSTFTITNLGMYEIDAFTPIINLPECAILGVGRIAPKQMVMDVDAGRVEIRHMVFLSLTFDHRVADGAPAARFLQRVKKLVEKPYLWLVN